MTQMGADFGFNFVVVDSLPAGSLVAFSGPIPTCLDEKGRVVVDEKRIDLKNMVLVKNIGR